VNKKLIGGNDNGNYESGKSYSSAN
jgi:hypothetical protein